MDLDKIKKEWQETPVEVHLDDEQIGRMIDQKGQTAFNKLVKYEKIGLVVSVLLLFMANIFIYKELSQLYRVVVVVLFFWQLYKCWYLRKVDLKKMSIVDISKYYIRYKRFIIVENIFGILFFLFFVLFYGFLKYKNESDFMEEGIIVFSIIFGIAFLCCIWMIWRMYLRHLLQLGRSIQEVKDLESE